VYMHQKGVYTYPFPIYIAKPPTIGDAPGSLQRHLE